MYLNKENFEGNTQLLCRCTLYSTFWDGETSLRQFLTVCLISSVEEGVNRNLCWGLTGSPPEADERGGILILGDKPESILEGDWNLSWAENQHRCQIARQLVVFFELELGNTLSDSRSFVVYLIVSFGLRSTVQPKTLDKKTYRQHTSYVMQLHYRLCVPAARHIANNETSTQIFSAFSLC